MLLQALDKALDTSQDICKAMKGVQFDQQLLNKVCLTEAAAPTALLQRSVERQSGGGYPLNTAIARHL